MERRLLVIDDDAAINDSLVEVLRMDGYSVVTATNGAEGLGLLLAMEPKPYAVLTDILMPVMDGRTFLEEKAKHSSIAEVPVLVLTAGKTDVAGSDVVGLLRKPFGINDLFDCLERIAPSDGGAYLGSPDSDAFI